MKVTKHKTTQISGSLHPHGQKDQITGPFSLRIGATHGCSEPLGRRNPQNIRLCVEQPNERDNFTLIKLLYLRTGTRKPSFVAGCEFHNARHYRRKDGTIEVRIKKRYCVSFPSPLPVGRYVGTCMYEEGGSFVLVTLQSNPSLIRVREPEPAKSKTIITPEDPEYGFTLEHAARTLSRANGVEGRGADAGGLRHGQLPDGVPPGGSGEVVG